MQVDVSRTLTLEGREVHGSLPCRRLPSDQAPPPVPGATATTARAPKAGGRYQCTHNPRSFRKERARRQSLVPCIAPVPLSLNLGSHLCFLGLPVHKPPSLFSFEGTHMLTYVHTHSYYTKHAQMQTCYMHSHTPYTSDSAHTTHKHRYR